MAWTDRDRLKKWTAHPLWNELRGRILTQTDFSARSGCWLWKGPTNRTGYGLCRLGSRQLAHRVAWELEHGALDPEACVLHACDVPRCVNPDHLFLGTRADNLADCRAKGRMPKQRRKT